MAQFDLGDILSITTGRLVSRDHIGGVYRILGFMTGEELFTHALPRAADECAPALLVQHPDLADIVVPEDIHSKEAADAWLDSLVPVYGRTREVSPLASDDHTHIDPLTELRMRNLRAKTIVVELP